MKVQRAAREHAAWQTDIRHHPTPTLGVTIRADRGRGNGVEKVRPVAEGWKAAFHIEVDADGGCVTTSEFRIQPLATDFTLSDSFAPSGDIGLGDCHVASLGSIQAIAFFALPRASAKIVHDRKLSQNPRKL